MKFHEIEVIFGSDLTGTDEYFKYARFSTESYLGYFEFQLFKTP